MDVEARLTSVAFVAGEEAGYCTTDSTVASQLGDPDVFDELAEVICFIRRDRIHASKKTIFFEMAGKRVPVNVLMGPKALKGNHRYHKIRASE